MVRPRAARLAALRKLMFGVAAFNLMVGAVGVARPGRLATALGFDGVLYALGWGLVYAAFALFFPVKPVRSLFAVAVVFVMEGTTLIWAAMDRGASWPLAGMVLRFAWLALATLVFSAVRAAREETADAALAASRRVRARTFAPAAGPTAQQRERVLGEQKRLRRVEADTRSLVGTPQARAGIRSVAGVVSRADAAADVLRWVAKRLVIGQQGVTVSDANERELELSYAEVQGLCVQRLPGEPPWDGQVLLEIVPVPGRTPPPVVRVFSTTRISLPPELGPAPTARLDLVRKLSSAIAQRAPSVEMDEATARFVREGAPPARLASAKDLADHDARYG